MFDKKEEALIKNAFEDYHDLLDDATAQEEVESVVLSPELDAQMEKLMGKQQHFYYRFINTAAKRVACVLAAVLLAATITTASVEALREGFIHFVVEIFDQKTTVSLPGEDSDTFFAKEPAYIPQGYRLASHTGNATTAIRLYKGAGYNNFQFSQHPKGTDITVYTETTDYRTVTIAGRHEGILFENLGELFLIFNDGEHMYAIIGTLSEEEAFRVAESLFETR